MSGGTSGVFRHPSCSVCLWSKGQVSYRCCQILEYSEGILNIPKGHLKWHKTAEFWCPRPGVINQMKLRYSCEYCFTEKLKVVPGPFPGQVPACLAWLLLCVPGAALDPQHILAKPDKVLWSPGSNEVTARG